MRKEASHRPISDSYLAKLILYHLSFLPTGLVLGNFAPQGYDVAHLTPIDKPDWTCEARAVEGARRLEEAKKRPENDGRSSINVHGAAGALPIFADQYLSLDLKL